MKHLFYINILITIQTINTFGNPPGSNIFNFDGIHDIHITFTQPDYWDLLTQYKNQGDTTGKYTYLAATVDFDGQVIPNTGIRFKGNSSYWNEGKKKSIKLKFNEFVSGQKLDGLKKVNLNNNFNDPTLMREKLFLDILKRNDVFAPRCTYARVYINEVYWGLYTMVDHIDKVFLLTNFHDKSGNLYKGDRYPWITCANLSFHPDPMAYRECYTLKTHEEQNEWHDLENLIYMINHTPPQEYHLTMDSLINAASFINAWAANIVFVNVDSYVETGHNYYTYHNPLNNKFEWITWDVNEAFGLWNVGMPLEQLYNLDIFYLPPNPEQERPLSFFMLQDSIYRKMYINRVFELVNEEFKPSRLFPEIDRLYNLIRNDVYRDTNKIIGNEAFENNIHEDVLIPDYPRWVPGLKSFVQLRSDLLRMSLSDLGYEFTDIPGSLVYEPGNRISIYPNPAYDKLNIVINAMADQMISIEIYNVNGLLLRNEQVNSKFIQINISDYPEGIYYIKVKHQKEIKIEKIVKL